MNIARMASSPLQRFESRAYSMIMREASDGEAFSAAAGALGIRIVEHEAGGEFVFLPVHPAADQVEDRSAIDVEVSSRRLDLLVERIFKADIIDRIGEP